MKIACQSTGSAITVSLELADDDRTLAPRRARGFTAWEPVAPGEEANGFRLIRRECRFDLPAGWRLDNVHPDAFALAISFLILPFTKTLIRMPLAVSTRFAAAFQGATRRAILPVDDRLESRRAPLHSRPVLAFSGGVDSTAALAVLPADTVAVHLTIPGARARGEGGGASAAAIAACRQLENVGRDVAIVESDLRTMIEPAGFSTHQVVASPALLLAGQLDAGSVSFGTVMCTAYGVGDRRFIDPLLRPGWGSRASLFDSVGVSYAAPVAGLTEVGTAQVAMAGSLAEFVRSCERGTPERPCMACVKCFRKTLVAMAVRRRFEGLRELERMASIPSIRDHLSQVPIHHEGIYAWAASRYEGRSRLMQALQRRTRSHELDLRWISRWYEPSIALVPDGLRDEVAGRVASLVNPMDERDRSAARSFDLDALVSDPVVFRDAAELRRVAGRPMWLRILADTTRRARRALARA